MTTYSYGTNREHFTTAVDFARAELALPDVQEPFLCKNVSDDPIWKGSDGIAVRAGGCLHVLWYGGRAEHPCHYQKYLWPSKFPPDIRPLHAVADADELRERVKELERIRDQYEKSWESQGMDMHPAYVESFNHQKSRAGKAEAHIAELEAELAALRKTPADRDARFWGGGKRLMEDVETYIAADLAWRKDCRFATHTAESLLARVRAASDPVKPPMPTRTANQQSTKHPHEPDIPQAIDAEGRCRVCLLLVGIAQAERELTALKEGREAMCRGALIALSGAGACTPVEGYGDDVGRAVADLIQALEAAKPMKPPMSMELVERCRQLALNNLGWLEGNKGLGPDIQALRKMIADLAKVSDPASLEDEVARFVRDFYPHTNHERRMEHFLCEVRELRESMPGQDRVDEAADCALILIHMMLAEGAQPLVAMTRKLAEARRRIESGEKKPRPFADAKVSDPPLSKSLVERCIDQLRYFARYSCSGAPTLERQTRELLADLQAEPVQPVQPSGITREQAEQVAGAIVNATHGEIPDILLRELGTPQPPVVTAGITREQAEYPEEYVSNLEDAVKKSKEHIYEIREYNAELRRSIGDLTVSLREARGELDRLRELGTPQPPVVTAEMLFQWSERLVSIGKSRSVGDSPQVPEWARLIAKSLKSEMRAARDELLLREGVE